MARSNARRLGPNGSNGPDENRVVRCAIYTRKSTEEGLQQDFNSLDAQREAAEAFIASGHSPEAQFDKGTHELGFEVLKALYRAGRRCQRVP